MAEREKKPICVIGIKTPPTGKTPDIDLQLIRERTQHSSIAMAETEKKPICIIGIKYPPTEKTTDAPLSEEVTPDRGATDQDDISAVHQSQGPVLPLSARYCVSGAQTPFFAAFLKIVYFARQHSR